MKSDVAIGRRIKIRETFIRTFSSLSRAGLPLGHSHTRLELVDSFGNNRLVDRESLIDFRHFPYDRPDNNVSCLDSTVGLHDKDKRRLRTALDGGSGNEQNATVR